MRERSLPEDSIAAFVQEVLDNARQVFREMSRWLPRVAHVVGKPFPADLPKNVSFCFLYHYEGMHDLVITVEVGSILDKLL